jgi:hypothetical protein
MVMDHPSRQPARSEAVENRRANRRARRHAEHAKAQRRDSHDREVSVRMSRLFFPSSLYPEGPPLVSLDIRYWQARRCGWDVLDKEHRTDALGKPCHPMDSVLWWWWTHVHYKQRSQLVAMSGFRLTRLK